MTTSSEKDSERSNGDKNGSSSQGGSNVPASGTIVPGGPNGPDGTIIEEVMTTVFNKKQPVRGQAFRAQSGEYVSYLCTDDDAFYRPGDSVYIESQKADQPYFICTIQEFRRSKRDNLMVNIKWYYRPSEVPETVYQLLVQDRNTENNNKALAIDAPIIKSRELFISDATDSYPVSVLKGICKVEHYTDIHAVRDFKPEPDSFFYILGYNPETRRLASTQGEIRIGPSHQAKLPEYRGDLPIDMRPEVFKEDICWIPDRVTASDIKMYLSAARSVAATANGQLIGSYLSGSTIASKDPVTINAYDNLHACNYEKNLALNEMVKCPIPAVLKDKWADEEVKRFGKGVRLYGKNFFRIRNEMLTNRTTKEVVWFYYLWKKTAAAAGNRPTRRQRRPNGMRRIRNTRGNARNPGPSDPMDPSSASEKEADSDDSDSKDRQGYHCRHCYTTSSRDWHHAGKDKKLLCYDCRMNFKHYGELPKITNPRDPPPATPQRPPQPAVKEEVGIRTRTRAKELNNRNKASVKSRANTPEPYEEPMESKSTNSNSPASRKNLDDKKFKRGRSGDEEQTDLPTKKKYQSTETPASSSDDSADEGCNEAPSCEDESVSEPIVTLQVSAISICSEEVSPVKMESNIEMPESPENLKVPEKDSPNRISSLEEAQLSDISNDETPVKDDPPSESVTSPNDSLGPSDLSMTANSSHQPKTLSVAQDLLMNEPTDLSNGPPPAHSRVYNSHVQPPVSNSTLSHPSAINPPPAHSSIHSTPLPLNPPVAHVSFPTHPAFGPVSFKTTQAPTSPPKSNALPSMPIGVNLARIPNTKRMDTPGYHPMETSKSQDRFSPSPIYSTPSVPTHLLPSPLLSVSNLSGQTTADGPSFKPESRLELEHLRHGTEGHYPFMRAHPDSLNVNIPATTHNSQSISPPPKYTPKPFIATTVKSEVKKEFESFRESFKANLGKPEVKLDIKREIKTEQRFDRDRPEIIAEVKAEHKHGPFSAPPQQPFFSGIYGYPTHPSMMQHPYLPSKPFSRVSPPPPFAKPVSPPGSLRHSTISPAHMSSPFIPGKPPVSVPPKTNNQPRSLKSPNPGTSLPPPAHTGPAKPLNSAQPVPLNRQSPGPYYHLGIPHQSPASSAQPPTTQALPPTVPPNHSGFSAQSNIRHEEDRDDDVSPPINREPSPPPKIDDTLCHRSVSAMFLRHWNRGEFNSCARTDLTFKPTPESTLNLKREERERKAAARERDEKEERARKKCETPERREPVKTPASVAVGPPTPGHPLYERAFPRPPPDPSLARLGSIAGSSGMRPGILPHGLQAPAGAHLALDPMMQHYGSMSALYPLPRERLELDGRELDRLKEELIKQQRSHLEPHPSQYLSIPHHLLATHRFHHMGPNIPTSLAPAAPPNVYCQPQVSNANIIAAAAERDRMERLAMAYRPGLIRPADPLQARLTAGFPPTHNSALALNRQYEEHLAQYMSTQEQMHRHLMLERDRMSHMNPQGHYRP